MSFFMVCCTLRADDKIGADCSSPYFGITDWSFYLVHMLTLRTKSITLDLHVQASFCILTYSSISLGLQINVR